MNPSTIARYQPGGDLYNTIAAKYGTAQANTIAAAAATGDQYQFNAALSGLNVPGSTADLPTGTLGIFGNQLATDPFGAPLDSLNGVLSNTFLSFLKNPAVLVTVAIVLFIALGGFGWISRRYFK